MKWNPSRRWKLLNWLCNSQHNLKLALGNVYVHADSPTAAGNKLPKTRRRNKPSHLRTAWLWRALYMTSAKRSSRQTQEQNESKRKIHAGSVNLISCLTCSLNNNPHVYRHQTPDMQPDVLQKRRKTHRGKKKFTYGARQLSFWDFQTEFLQKQNLCRTFTVIARRGEKTWTGPIRGLWGDRGMQVSHKLI